jgi:hypothetical protein
MPIVKSSFLKPGAIISMQKQLLCSEIFIEGEVASKAFNQFAGDRFSASKKLRSKESVFCPFLKDGFI